MTGLFSVRAVWYRDTTLAGDVRTMRLSASSHRPWVRLAWRSLNPSPQAADSACHVLLGWLGPTGLRCLPRRLTSLLGRHLGRPSLAPLEGKGKA